MNINSKGNNNSISNSKTNLKSVFFGFRHPLQTGLPIIWFDPEKHFLFENDKNDPNGKGNQENS